VDHDVPHPHDLAPRQFADSRPSVWGQPRGRFADFGDAVDQRSHPDHVIRYGRAGHARDDGGGTGKKIATVGGAVAGGYAGNEIEKRQRSTTVWVVKMRNADQSNRTMTFSHDPGVQSGDVVRVSDGQLIRQ
jgi:hypothetical protein